ncbi:DUF4124 domain-containing protein [Hydrogenophaga sp.]|uniref:DUF4124 domain-containing protein n=1 Tax=Hydrogenophaga sp. TaxID=1904254 RepID=UPI002AC98DF0|nr:DUF4124 domain-containing protein [Hydrogenophaga sp.]
MNTLHRLAVLFVAWCAMAATAQTVYRCEAQGKVGYSHEPCVGAKPVDTTPTQGLDKSSGKSRKGADVRRAETDKMFGEAIRPITGMDQKQRDTLHRRFKLPHAAKLECAVLDSRLTGQEFAERNAAPQSLKAAQQELFESRKRYRELSC